MSRALAAARCQTDSLFGLVRPDSLYERPIPERHRILFYIGHVEAFDWNLVGRYALDLPAFHAEFDKLFSFGIDPGPGNLPADTPADWPSLAEVREYNARVRETLDRTLSNVPEQLLHVALEHRLMHAETFAYMLHNLEPERKCAPLLAPAESAASPRPEMVEIPAGDAALGRQPGDGFGWDNEYAAHTVAVGAFRAARYKVTNGEYLAFVEAGGEVPHFWVRRGGRWFYRGMFREVPLPLDWPVYATHEQATAFARWAGKRLPTEAEYHRAAEGAVPDAARDNFDFHSWDPVPVTSGCPSPRGLFQVAGNGWEWTSSVFAPFAGFAAFPFYPGYSADFFDGAHYVLKGASPRTAACMVRPSFRNWFRGSYPYMYAAFRLVESR